jgi:hypothetical protein
MPQLPLPDRDNLDRMVLGAAQCSPIHVGSAIRTPANASAGADAGTFTCSEVSLGKVLEHVFSHLYFCQKVFDPGVLFLQLHQPIGFLGPHTTVLIPAPVIRRFVISMTRQTMTTALPWPNSCSAVFSLRLICSDVCLVGFILGSPAQSGRMRTLIHAGPISLVHVMYV